MQPIVISKNNEITIIKVITLPHLYNREKNSNKQCQIGGKSIRQFGVKLNFLRIYLIKQRKIENEKQKYFQMKININ